MSATDPDECCPVFDPEPWDGKEFQWQDKLFVKDRVRGFMHIPLNFGAVMTRDVGRIEAADAKPGNMVVLSDENSLWGSDIYLEVTKDVPDADVAGMSGTFLSKVFEGPYGNTRRWVREMKEFAQTQGKSPQNLYFYYTTCPKCAKKYGKNYVVILAKV